MDANDLYGLPLERFVPERQALVKELRHSGEKEAAEAVARLRKPSVAAWAVNQLVRTQGQAAMRLFAAGDAAQRAQSELLAGRGDGNALREALAAERQAVGELVEVARGLLSSDGHELSPAMLERVAETLHAAALEEAARDEVIAGCLERELRHVGLGPSGERPPVQPRPRASSKGKANAAADLRKAESAARRAAERAARNLEAAQGQRDAAARALDAAEAALSEAREQARQATAAHEKASRALRQRR